MENEKEETKKKEEKKTGNCHIFHVCIASRLLNAVECSCRTVFLGVCRLFLNRKSQPTTFLEACCSGRDQCVSFSAVQKIIIRFVLEEGLLQFFVAS